MYESMNDNLIVTKFQFYLDTETVLITGSIINPLLQNASYEQLNDIYSLAIELKMFDISSFMYEIIDDTLIFKINSYFYRNQLERLHNREITIDDIIKYYMGEFSPLVAQKLNKG